MDALEQAKVTLIVTPRERFGVARESLQSIFDHTTVPFDLIYVDAAGPKDLSAWIAEQAKARGFQHLSFPRILAPNEARNAGVRRAKTPFVVFIDNDVICSPNWIEPLIVSAESSDADVVAPLTCQGLPVHTEIHQAGGLFTKDIESFFAAPRGERIIDEVMHHQGRKIDDIPKQLVETQCCEFHCVLVRRSVFDRIGELDIEMLATKEHLDFCMSVLEHGGTVLLEPRSVVTYLFPNRLRPIAPRDWPFFLVRWSKAWQLRSLDRFKDKWGLKPDQPYFATRAGMLTWRYKEGVVKPLVKKLPGINRNRFLSRATGVFVAPFVSAAGAAMTARADRLRRLNPEL